jgi:inner membrane protein
VGIAISDTRGIEKQISLTSGDASIPFVPGSDLPVLDGAGLHAAIPLALLRKDVPFSFAVAVKGSEGIAFAPVGKESTIALTSSWTSPKFSGAFLPTDRSVTDSGFSAEWRISSFGRSYPQVWQGSEVGFERVLSSTAGADLYEQTDFYTKIDRSIKYAILFIAVTFLVLFLFETLARIRIHPLQYLLVGAALALFYLLLLSFSEQIGFFVAYLLATLMTAFLISLYCARVLGAKGRAFGMFAMLIALYGYLYFVLLLEDYALLFGSLLIFVLLATVMYLTRNVNWFEIAKKKQGA